MLMKKKELMSYETPRCFMLETWRFQGPLCTSNEVPLSEIEDFEEEDFDF